MNEAGKPFLSARCRPQLWRLGGLMVGAMALWLLVEPIPEQGQQQPRFGLEAIKHVRLGATNAMVFRLTTSGGGRKILLPNLGDISTQLDGISTQSTAHISVLRRYGLDRVFSPSQCLTNFIPTVLRKDMEFAIVVPTNEVWQLCVTPLGAERPWEALRRKLKDTWASVTSRDIAALRQVWSGRGYFGENYPVWSRPFTNAVPKE
jgi:hypothetical protein